MGYLHNGCRPYRLDVETMKIRSRSAPGKNSSGLSLRQEAPSRQVQMVTTLKPQSPLANLQGQYSQRWLLHRFYIVSGC